VLIDQSECPNWGGMSQDEKETPKKIENPVHSNTQGEIELVEIPEDLERLHHNLLQDVRANGLRKKWLWNWYFVIILGTSNDSYKKGKTGWGDSYDTRRTGGRIVLEKIDTKKYKFYKYYDGSQQGDYNSDLHRLRNDLSPLIKEFHHWACFDQGGHGSEYSKERNMFTGLIPTIKGQ
jgi:hypothetical protein